MAITTTIKKKGNEAKVSTTTFEQIKNPGRKTVDYSNVYGQAFTNRIYKKIHTINKEFNRFKDYAENNEFNYFITLSAVTPECKKAILDSIKDADKSSSFVSLAAWTWETETGDLHYHIMLNSSLSQEKIEKRLAKCNYDIKIIYDQKKLVGYFRKNVNDTIYVLKQTEKTTLNVEYADLRAKQLEILGCSKILTNSTNLNKTEVTVIKNATDEDVKKLEKEYDCKTSYKFAKFGVNVKVSEYSKKDAESTTTSTTTIATKVVESITVDTKAEEVTPLTQEQIDAFLECIKNNDKKPTSPISLIIKRECDKAFAEYKAVSTVLIPKEAQIGYNKAILTLNMSVKSTSCIECS